MNMHTCFSHLMLCAQLLDAWKASSGEYNGYKFFATLAGLPVGPARLPNLPVESDPPTEKALRESFASFCAGDGKGLRMCA